MSPQPRPGPSAASSRPRKEAVKFSTLENPPRANLLPPAALLSLLCLAFLCLVFVCFRHTEWIVKARKKMWKMVKEQGIKLSDQFEEFKFNRQRRIKLFDDDEDDDGEEGHHAANLGGGASGATTSTDGLHSLNLSSHHHQHQQQPQIQSQIQSQIQARLLGPDRRDDSLEELDDEDNEVLPQVVYSK
ncbi:hypothetical protein PCASD_06712 [Puccinia coronata f. sp. avenae]|uniref:Uncharacterized protein n=1 Tax=Puccinia coronata f. sp. avenae TaxID=200324 RepID=A0A2N5TF65_9BASI|nr:hypothetical protein PCASD_06712 [Puccinia coronata f. sp. avenae]